MCRALQLVAEADGLLVVGSSLMVYSAFRLAKTAKDRGAQIAAVCVGLTRADDFINLKVQRKTRSRRTWNLLPFVHVHLQMVSWQLSIMHLLTRRRALRRRRWSHWLAKSCRALRRTPHCCCHERGDMQSCVCIGSRLTGDWD